MTYIISANFARRHMTQGQKAIVAARLASTESVLQHQAATVAGVSKQHVSNATTILDYAPDLADKILAGAPFASAYEEAKQRRALSLIRQGRAVPSKCVPASGSWLALTFYAPASGRFLVVSVARVRPAVYVGR